MRQIRWFELIKDYDLIIDYHLGKANLVVDALSQKSFITLAHIHTAYLPLSLNIKTMRINLDYDGYEFTRLLYRSYLEVMDWFVP